MIYIYIILVILIFGLLITLHELGHFITAKLSGVRVNEFAVGMGPAILKKQRGETLYALRLIPFGGYCAMEGEDGSSDSPGSFQNKPIWRRIIIVVAGSIMNLLVGLLVLALVFAPTKSWGTPTIAQVDTRVEGLQAGDTITKIDDYGVILSNDIEMGLDRGKNKPNYTIEVRRNGEKVVLDNVLLKQYEFEVDGKKQMRYGLSLKVEESTFFGKAKFVLQNGYNLVRMVKVGLVDLVTG
ncbi:MAG: site-2 protease family protein, partial [Clostridia bacterium]